ncbi:putative RNA methyltransferase family protein [Brugia pahangi]
MSEEIISDNGKERLKKRSGNMFKRKKELSWRKKKAAMKQFREDILLEQLIRKPEVSNALVADTNDVGMNKIRNNGKFVMLSIALPGSILNNAQSPELRTYLAGQIARSAAVFCIDEIIVYDETARMKSQQREDYCNGQWYPDLPVHSGNVECNFHLAKILEFMECPQYLRKTLFPLQKTLKYAGILNPLDCPHHLRASDLSVPYREGVVLDKPIKAGRGPICNVGLYKEVQINEDVTLKTGTRVTVKILDIYSERKRYHGCLVNSKQIKQEAGLYWGYKVRLALSLYDALNAEEYDVIIGTSERGKPVSKFEMPFSGKNRILIVFGGLEGLETAVEADKNISCSTPEELFEHYLNVVPGQGSRIIRTEEAIPITLATLRPMICTDL